MEKQPQQQEGSGGVQQPDHTLVNLLENRGQVPGRKRRGEERGKGGVYRERSGHSRISGSFSDLLLHSGTTDLLPGNTQTLREPGEPGCLIPVLEPVSSSR